ncbi:MAG: MauE/DoxX family redox-associated membrane protein [Gemmatimonadaceae bacterium]
MLTAVAAPAGDQLRSALSLAFRFTIAAVWIVAAALKLRSAVATRTGVDRLLGVAWANAFVARVLAPAELALGLSLLIGWHYRASAIVSALFFLVFALLVGRAAIRQSIAAGGCGCFGVRPAVRDDDTTADAAAPRAIARNVVLAVLALAAAA